MHEVFHTLMQSRGFYYLFGVMVVAFIVFTTAARHPEPTCSRCRQVNRPNARYCAHCGQPLFDS